LQVGGIKLNCTDMVLQQQADATELQRTLYCGYHQARCNGSSTTNQYAAGFDWRGSNVSSFAPDLYYNDTWGLPRNEAPTVYQRVPQVRSTYEYGAAAADVCCDFCYLDLYLWGLLPGA
jgi:hypothetical protein